MKIWKHVLKITDFQEISIPDRSKLLSVANQRGELCLWFEIDPQYETLQKRTIEIIGTGNLASESSRRFLGTVVMDPSVWHVYERLSKEAYR